MALLEVSRLTFRVGDRTILDGLDIAVAPAEIHALLGANGSGKTTLACIIMGCEGYVPTTGEIWFDGQRIEDLAIHQRARSGITLAWQEPARFEGLLVKDYLRLGKAPADPADCLKRVGLEPLLYLDRMVDKTLSGGERKRIELAAVLAQRPRLALLDEPTSGIDMLSIQEIIDVILALKREGTAVLLISHRQEVARVADRASYLCGGRILASGDPAAVVEQYRSRRCLVCDGELCRA
jgi:Fe-S cluster assembly ATP-binding protein